MKTWTFPYYDIEKGIDWDGIEKEFDWFRDMKNVPQDHIWHAEGDVQIHTKMVCEALINHDDFKKLSDLDKHIVFTSALMHDIEKRSTTEEGFRDGRKCIVAPRHAQRGEYTARRVLYKDIPTPFEIREHICKLVKLHGIPLWKEGDELEKKIIDSSLYVKINLLSLLSRADVLGRNCGDNTNLLEKIDYFELIAQDLGVFDKEYEFVNELHRYNYLAKDKAMEYVPFDDTKFVVHMVSGVAGSGKDTFIGKNYSDLPMISLDDIRREKKIKPTDKKGNGVVYQEAKERCKVLMRQKEGFVFNATNLIVDTRNKWVKLFEAYGGKVVIHYIEVPYKTLLTQNHNREHKVPEKVLNKMIRGLQIPGYDEAHEIYFNYEV